MIWRARPSIGPPIPHIMNGYLEGPVRVAMLNLAAGDQMMVVLPNPMSLFRFPSLPLVPYNAFLIARIMTLRHPCSSNTRDDPFCTFLLQHSREKHMDRVTYLAPASVGNCGNRK